MNSIKQQKVIKNDTEMGPLWRRVNATLRKCHEESDDRILQFGEKMRFKNTLLDAIEDARDVIIIATFLFSDRDLVNALRRASERNVRIYIITASTEKLTQHVRDDDEFSKRMLDDHKSLLKTLANHVNFRSSSHFHAKFLLIDPSTHPKGWISTANFNKALEDSVELGVRLHRDEVGELRDWFSWAFWSEAEYELAGKNRFARINREKQPATKRPISSSNLFVTNSETTTLRAKIKELICDTKEYLFISSYGIDADYELGSFSLPDLE